MVKYSPNKNTCYRFLYYNIFLWKCKIEKANFVAFPISYTLYKYNILDIVKKAGSWFSFNEEKLGQGRDKSKEFLANNPEILNTVETLVREKLAQNS